MTGLQNNLKTQFKRNNVWITRKSNPIIMKKGALIMK